MKNAIIPAAPYTYALEYGHIAEQGINPIALYLITGWRINDERSRSEPELAQLGTFFDSSELSEDDAKELSDCPRVTVAGNEYIYEYSSCMASEDPRELRLMLMPMTAADTSTASLMAAADERLRGIAKPRS